VTSVIARCIIVTIGTLYPAYRSYKSLINSDLREVVNCLRYWIVFALFIAAETITDIILSWFPFYYWIKIAVVLWMISPAGSTLIYKRFVQPLLKEREKEIDQLLERTKEKSYSTLIELSHKGFRYASNLFLNTALLGQAYLGEHLKRSFSTSDIINSQLQGYANRIAPLEEEEEQEDQTDQELQARLVEDRTYLKSVNGRKPITNNQTPENDDDRLSELEMANVIAQRTRARTGKNGPAANYSSTESSHYGTISKGQAQQILKRSKATAKTAQQKAQVLQPQRPPPPVSATTNNATDSSQNITDDDDDALDNDS